MALPASGPIALSQVQTEFGGSNPIGISEYYGAGAGGTTVPLGLSPALRTLSGSTASWATNYQVDISAYEGCSVRPVFLHTGMIGFRSDLQLDSIGFGTNVESFESASSVGNWQTTTAGNTADYSSASFAALADGATNGRWNRRSGGTPSSGTGIGGAADGSFYVYTETTSNFASANKYWLKRLTSTTITSSNNTLTFAEARVGADMGTLTAHVEVISAPAAGAPASGQISLSDFYGLEAAQVSVATGTLDAAYDGSLESVYTYLTNDRRGFGVTGKNDFYYPESVGTTYDDGFGSLTNASGLISGAGVTSITGVDTGYSPSNHVILQAQGAGLTKSSVTYMKVSGFYPTTGVNTSATLTSSDTRCIFGTPSRLTSNGITNMHQWVWQNGTTVPEGSITTAMSIILHAAANNLNVTIEIESQ